MGLFPAAFCPLSAAEFERDFARRASASYQGIDRHHRV